MLNTYSLRIILPFLTFFIAQSVATDFFWYFTNEEKGEWYEPKQYYCGKSCRDCGISENRPAAVQCHSDRFTNVCYVCQPLCFNNFDDTTVHYLNNFNAYLCSSLLQLTYLQEPSRDERCCEDREGISCTSSYYCGYDIDEVAVCCNTSLSVEECSSAFGRDLESSRRSPPVTATIIAEATISGSAASIAKPEQTETNVLNEQSIPSEKKGTGKGALAGIVVGSIVGGAVLAGGVAFFLHRRRRRPQYGQVNGAAEAQAQGFYPMQGTFPGNGAPDYMAHGALGAYEPVRKDARQSYQKDEKNYNRPPVQQYMDASLGHIPAPLPSPTTVPVTAPIRRPQELSDMEAVHEVAGDSKPQRRNDAYEM